MDNHIKICDLFGYTLDSREAASLVFERSDIFNILYIDFAGVEFMSRSFADQFIKESNNANQKGIRVILENVEESLKATLGAVKGTQHGHRKDWLNLPVITFYDKEELYKHLQTI